jgi:hypothetical protein
MIILFSIYDIIDRGANFCHVIKIMQLLHLIFSIISGIHRCIGAIPIFKDILIIVINSINVFKINIDVIRIEAINIIDPILWIIK